MADLARIDEEIADELAVDVPPPRPRRPAYAAPVQGATELDTKNAQKVLEGRGYVVRK